MPKTKYLMYIDYGGLCTDTETFREFEVEHPDDGLDGIEEAQNYTSDFVDGLFSDILRTIKSKHLDISWTRDLSVWELTGSVKNYELFCIAITAESDIEWIVNWHTEDWYSVSFDGLVKGWQAQETKGT